MKHIKSYIAIASVLLFSSCGVRNYSYKPTRNHQTSKITPPVGMIYIPGGSVMIGRDSSDLRKVSLSPFFMDKTEITNIQYREFVNWVRDSVIVHLLNEKVFFKRSSGKDSTKKIDWVRLNTGILWKSRNPRIRQKIESLYNDEQKIDNHLLNYEFVIKTRDGKKSVALINVWPNELSWIDDFPNSQNELMAKSYFTNPIFDNHPVVGISWKQARAYAHWRSKMINRYTNKIINPQILQLPIDLPTEAQWTYASQLSLPQKKKKEDSDLYQLNFKQGEGTYSNDGSTYTSHVMAYAPNGFGLFNMAGNVSEWTLDAYSESFKALIHDLNPVILYEAKDDEPLLMQRKVVKGGSWKDAASMTDPLIRTAETQNTGRSFIGFRCVMAAPDVIQAQQPPKHMATLKNKSVKLATN
ncbi:MAG: hypothetical protein E6Q85_00430 [Thiothrix sp.]|nr:MAG: hypothetical protein E6Q85_00430 [Thiothrix sp.]